VGVTFDIYGGFNPN